MTNNIFKKAHVKSLMDHMKDLRRLLVVLILSYLVFFICIFYNANFFLEVLTSSLNLSLEKYGIRSAFIATEITDVFVTHLIVAFYVSLFCYIPFFLLILFIFLQPAIKRKEAKYVYIIFILIPILFYMGVSFAYYFTFYAIWEFFIKFSFIESVVEFTPKIINYIVLALKIMLAFGISFEFLVVLLLLGSLGVITHRHIIKYLKYALVAFYVIAAVITPPDPISQIVVANVLLILYLSSYPLLKYIFNKK